MFSFAVLAASGLTLAVFLIILLVVQYFRDPKGLRKFENYSFLSWITNLCYCYLSARGFRSKDLYEAHKRNPILRVGSNSLSFGDIRAIKDIYGHGTKCAKDLNYVILKGSHTHLIDVVDKADHARKRKLMFAAFAIKNLERWEHKVAHSTQRLVEAFDGLCTKPLSMGQVTPDQADLTVDFNKWINLWTIEAINNIALSATLGLLEQGSDEVTAQRPDGTLYKARYRHAQIRPPSHNPSLSGTMIDTTYSPGSPSSSQSGVKYGKRPNLGTT
jgi:hypothetical protein